MMPGTLAHAAALLARIAQKPAPGAWPPAGYFLEHRPDGTSRGAGWGAWRGPWRTDVCAVIADCENHAVGSKS